MRCCRGELHPSAQLAQPYTTRRPIVLSWQSSALPASLDRLSLHELTAQWQRISGVPLSQLLQQQGTRLISPRCFLLTSSGQAECPCRLSGLDEAALECRVWGPFKDIQGDSLRKAAWSRVCKQACERRVCLQEFDMFCLQSLAVSITHSSDLDQTMHRISVVAIR